MPTDRKYIRELSAAELIEGAFSIQNAQLGQTKNGKAFLKCLIADRTGRTPGRMWSISEQLFESLPTDGFVYLKGQTQPYQGEMQIIIHDIRTHEPTDAELTELLPSTEKNIDEMFAAVVKLLGTIEHPALRCLADRYLEDGELMGMFCQAPAAQTLHHAYLGGLLEHTLQLMQLADAIVPMYPDVNRDLVLLGLLLHDIGKCSEITWKTGFGYSEDGQLVGHVARSTLWLAEKAKACEDPELGDAAVAIPEPIMRVLTHIILSHHGQPEFGALKIPATPEAIFISHLDDLDAKMNMATQAARREDYLVDRPDLGSDFTEKIWALGTRIYRPDPTKLE